MKKRTLRTLSIASGVIALASLGAGIANPIALVPHTYQVTKDVQNSGQLAPKNSHPLNVHVNDQNQFAFAEFSTNKAYIGQPLLLILGTTLSKIRVDALGGHTKAIRPVLDQYTQHNGQQTVIHFQQSPDTPSLTNPAGHVSVGYWQLSFPKPGHHVVTINFGHGHTRKVTVDVAYLPIGYEKVRYQGVSESTKMQIGIDPKSAYPKHLPWSFAVTIDTNHTHLKDVMGGQDLKKWSTPFIVHANERGKIVETLTTPSMPANTTVVSPTETFQPTQAATANYTAMYMTKRKNTVHNTKAVRFWRYWLASQHDAQSWQWKPILLVEWEWLVLTGLFAGLALFAGLWLRNRRGHVNSPGL